jgi:hypothetical protein
MGWLLGCSVLYDGLVQVSVGDGDVVAAASKPAGEPFGDDNRPVSAACTAGADDDPVGGRALAVRGDLPDGGPQQAANPARSEHGPLDEPVPAGQLPHPRVDMRVTERPPQIQDDVRIGGRSVQEAERHDHHVGHQAAAG